MRRVADYLTRQGKIVQAEGYDVAEEALAQARQRFPRAVFHNREFSANPYRRGEARITLTLLIDILEHSVDPAALLRLAGEVSESVICHLPLEDNFEVNARGLRKKFIRMVGHIHFYNTQGALALFRQAGFAVEHQHLTCSDCSADYRLASPLRRWIAQPLRKFFFRLSPQFTAAVLGNCSLLVRLRPVRSAGPN